MLASIPLNVLLRLAVRARVIEGLGVRESMRRAWATARQHWGVVIVLWLVQVAGTVAALAVLGLPLLVGAVALSAAAIAVGLVSFLWSIGLTALVGLIGWLAGGAVGGVIETFVSAMWTLAYREMHGLGLTGEAPPPLPLGREGEWDVAGRGRARAPIAGVSPTSRAVVPGDASAEQRCVNEPRR